MRVQISKLMLIIFVLFISGSIFAGNKKLIIEKSFDVTSGQTLHMDVSPGDVFVESWNKDEVKVLVYANSKAEDKLEFILKKTSDGVSVKTEREGSGWSWFNNMSVKFEVYVPKSFKTQISTSGGDIKIVEVTGKGELKTSGGDIVIEKNSGNFECRTSGGDIMAGMHVGDLALYTSGGDISTKRVEGNVEAKTSGGDIRVELAGGKVSAKTSGGDVRAYVADGFKGGDLRTSGGDIEIFIPSNTSADMNLYTSGGDVDVKVNGAVPHVVKSHKWEGKLNGGGAELTAKTSGGDIEVSSN